MQKIIEYLTQLKVLGHTPQAIQIDHGMEFLNDKLREWCRSEGVHFKLTVPYSPSQNGVVERMNRTLVELSCAMLSDSKLLEFLWEPAVAHAAYLHNLSYTKVKLHTTPYQGWHGKKPNVSHLHEFSAPVWVLLQGQNVQRKMLPKSQLLRSCSLNVQLVQRTEASTWRSRRVFIIIKTTEWQTKVKRFKSFRFTEVWRYKRETKSSLGLNFW